MVIYRDKLTAGLHVDPSATVRAVANQVMNFEMPGAGMPNFQRKAVEIAMAGIYDLRAHHDDVVWPLLKHWDVFAVEGLDEDGQRALEELRAFVDKLDAQAARFEEKREKRRAREMARAS